jgi:hypothetical protein
MTPKLHILTTAHGDNVILAMYDSEKVYIRGAERSMGRKWADGNKYTAKDARSLWEQIVYEGGRVVEVPMLNTLLMSIMAESEIDLTLKVGECEKKIADLTNALTEAQNSRDEITKLNEENVREIYSLHDQVGHLKSDLHEMMSSANQEAAFDAFTDE